MPAATDQHPGKPQKAREKGGANRERKEGGRVGPAGAASPQYRSAALAMQATPGAVWRCGPGRCRRVVWLEQPRLHWLEGSSGRGTGGLGRSRRGGQRHRLLRKAAAVVAATWLLTEAHCGADMCRRADTGNEEGGGKGMRKPSSKATCASVRNARRAHDPITTATAAVRCGGCGGASAAPGSVLAAPGYRSHQSDTSGYWQPAGSTGAKPPPLRTGPAPAVRARYPTAPLRR